MTAPVQPGGWVEGIGWVALLSDLSNGDHLSFCYDGGVGVVDVLDNNNSDDPTPVIVTRWADGTTPQAPTLTPEQFGMLSAPPALTYLDDADEVWIGSKYDVARDGDYWRLYRKGTHMLTAYSMAAVLAVVADVAAKFPKDHASWLAAAGVSSDR